MTEKNKREAEKIQNRKEKTKEKKNDLSEDEKNRRYYYDDSHGYEIYKPDEEEDD